MTQGSIQHSESTRLRQGRMCLTVLLVYALLVATHRGEFWPFSIFPMFSRGGRAFTRVVVRELGGHESVTSGPIWYSQLPGRPLALQPLRIDQNDLSKLLISNTALDGPRLSVLEGLFAAVSTRFLLVYAAHGQLDSTGNVSITYRPLVRIGPDGAQPMKAGDETVE